MFLALEPSGEPCSLPEGSVRIPAMLARLMFLKECRTHLARRLVDFGQHSVHLSRETPAGAAPLCNKLVCVLHMPVCSCTCCQYLLAADWLQCIPSDDFCTSFWHASAVAISLQSLQKNHVVWLYSSVQLYLLPVPAVTAWAVWVLIKICLAAAGYLSICSSI